MCTTLKNTKVAMEFHRTNLQDEYNYGMNKIDLGDQLRNYYRMDRWKRQFKWWFALQMWGFEVSLVNAYIAYTKMCTNLYKMEKRNIWTHYEFQKWVALGWINSEKYGPKSRKFIEAIRKNHSIFQGCTVTVPDDTTPTSIYIRL